MVVFKSFCSVQVLPAILRAWDQTWILSLSKVCTMILHSCNTLGKDFRVQENLFRLLESFLMLIYKMEGDEKKWKVKQKN
jgi:hypothetical protein